MHGETYLPERDEQRLTTQLDAVQELMKDGRWYTLESLRNQVRSVTQKHATESSISARIRDLRKPEFGGYEMQHRHVSNGLWEYRMVVDQMELF